MKLETAQDLARRDFIAGFNTMPSWQLKRVFATEQERQAYLSAYTVAWNAAETALAELTPFEVKRS
jgi:hypothetical protein